MTKNIFSPLLFKILLMLAIISGYASFQGLSLVQTLNGGGFLERAETTLFAFGISLAIYLVWVSLYKIMPTLKTRQGRIILLLAVLLVPVPMIIAGSSHPNAAGISGKAALSTHVNRKISEFDLATSLQYEQVKILAGLSMDLELAIGKFETIKSNEYKYGAYSGTSGTGAVYNSLVRITNSLEALKASVEAHQLSSKSLLKSAHNLLEKMRATSKQPSDQSMVNVSNLSDKLRSVLQDMDIRSISSSMGRILENIPKEASLLSGNLSSRPEIAKAQKKALERLQQEIRENIEQLGKLSVQLGKMEPLALPELKPITPMAAIRIYWLDYTTVWAIGILIDIAGLFPLIFFVIAKNEKTESENRREATLNLTLEQLLAAQIGQMQLKGIAFENNIIKKLNDDLLGIEQEKK